MAAIEDRNTLGRARLSFADEADIDEFVTMLERFERGEIDAGRVARLPAAARHLRPAAGGGRVRCCASRSRRASSPRRSWTRWPTSRERYSRGFGHITTRQNIQFHFVKLHDVEPAMRRLAEAGLTTREACGNSVRNITGCPYAGRRRRRAVRRHAVRRGDDALPAAASAQLVAAAQVQDRLRGLRRRSRRDRASTTSAGARVSAPDGGARLPRHRRRRHGDHVPAPAASLFEFLPAGEIFNVAEAVIRVFHRLGDYKHKQRNRLKFLIKSLGWDALARASSSAS